MKSQNLKFITAVVFSVMGLLSATAKADMDVLKGTSQTATIKLSLDIAEKCTIHGIETSRSLNMIQTANSAIVTIDDIYADCNSSTSAPKIKFSSANGSATAAGDKYSLVNSDSKTIDYKVSMNDVEIKPNQDHDFSTDAKKKEKLVIEADIPAKAQAGSYTDTLTATITL